VEHLILNKAEGQLNTGKMMYRLLNHVRSLGVDVYNGMSILGWTQIQDGYEIETAEFKIKTKLLVVATNGFARELLPELQVEPGRAQVLVTEPIPDLKIRGSFHYDKGYFYFRNVGNRLLFGGGRNLDFATEKTMTFGLTPLVQNKLEELLSEVILPRQQPKIEQRWSGIMGLGRTKNTIVKKITQGLYCAVRMGGMGVAIGTLVGEEAANLVCEEN
jgi:glycine/D-amino acid oxidase-like deaminating enzyme